MSRSEEAVKGELKGWFFPLGGQGICELGGRAAKERPLNFGLPQVCCKAVAPEVGGGCFAWGGMRCSLPPIRRERVWMGHPGVVQAHSSRMRPREEWGTRGVGGGLLCLVGCVVPSHPSAESAYGWGTRRRWIAYRFVKKNRIKSNRLFTSIEGLILEEI